MTDQFVIAESYDTANRETVDWSVSQRRNLRVTDNNNGSYSANSVVFDLATVSNSGKFVSLAESVVCFPVTITVTRPNGSNPVEANKFLAGLKSNHCIVDGISASLSNMPVIGYQKMNPARVAYSLATEWTQDDYARATQWGMAWEDGRAFKYNATNSAYGLKGCSSTSVAGFEPTATDIDEYIAGLEKVKPNQGRKRRQEAMRYGPDTELEALKGIANSKDERQSYMSVNTATSQVFNIDVRVSLAHLDPFFRNAPISKNGLWRIEFYLNIASMTVVLEGGATALGATAKNKKYKTIAVTTSQGYNPLQLGSLATNDCVGAMAVGDLSMSVEMKIGNTGQASCYMDIALLDMSPEAESAYLKESVKTFNYDKCMYQKIQNVTAGNTSNVLLSAGTSRARRLVILPYYMNDNTDASLSDILSPFNSFGAQTLSSPLCSVTDFNILVSGLPLYQTALKFQHQFYDEFKRWTLNNGVDTADINSCMVDLDQYASQYGAIVCDLTKHAESEDDLSKSYSVEFKNNTNLTCSYICMLFYEATISQNVETGQIVV